MDTLILICVVLAIFVGGYVYSAGSKPVNSKKITDSKSTVGEIFESTKTSTTRQMTAAEIDSERLVVDIFLKEFPNLKLGNRMLHPVTVTLNGKRPTDQEQIESYDKIKRIEARSLSLRMTGDKIDLATYYESEPYQDFLNARFLHVYSVESINVNTHGDKAIVFRFALS